MLRFLGYFYCKKGYYHYGYLGCLYGVYESVDGGTGYGFGDFADDYYHIFSGGDNRDGYFFIKKSIFSDHFISELIWLRKEKLLKLGF